MGRRARQLTFAEFGVQFIRHAVTPDVLGQNLARLVPPEQTLTLSSPTAIEVNARTTVGAVRQLPEGDPERELAFEVPLQSHLVLHVSLMLGQERYGAVAETTLRLTARALAPLTIQVDAEPVGADQVAVSSEGLGNWFDLVKRFGGLDDAIRSQVARMIDLQIEQSRRERTIDVRRLIALATAPEVLAPRRRRRPRRAAQEQLAALAYGLGEPDL